MTVTGGEFARVLAEAGEPPAADRPEGWAGSAALASMREAVAVHTAARAARWAVNAGRRRAGREAYEAACEAAGASPGHLPPWLADEPPAWELL